jgi:hypothetical protein
MEQDTTEVPTPSRDAPPVLGYATPAPLLPQVRPAGEWEPIVFWLIARRLVFALGTGMLMYGIGEGLFRGDAATHMGWGGGFIGLCIPLGPLPKMMCESPPPQRR